MRDDDQLTNNHFRTGLSTYFAAFLLLNLNPSIPTEELIQKALDIYNRMKKAHPFITNSTMYPFIVLLANRSESVDLITNKAEDIYHSLNDHGFRKGHDLHMLSQLFTLDHKRLSPN